MFKIVNREEMSDGTVILNEVEAPKIAQKAKPGQFVILKANETGERIPLTMAETDPDKGTITIIYQVVGKSTALFKTLQVGDDYQDVIGPLGKPTHIEKIGKIVCVGGGCGIAPMRNIILTLYDKWPERTCWLFFGCRTTRDIFYLKEWEEFSTKHPNFHVIYALSDKLEEGEQWDGETGFIHLSADKYLEPDVRRQAFLCGPPPMIEAVTRVLEEKGVVSEDIFYDEF